MRLQILYLYASIKTYDGKDEVFARIERDADKNCNVGLLSKQTDLYKALKKHLY